MYKQNKKSMDSSSLKCVEFISMNATERGRGKSAMEYSFCIASKVQATQINLRAPHTKASIAAVNLRIMNTYLQCESKLRH